MMVRHPLCVAVGSIHAINVIADDRPNDAEAGTLTRAFVPLKLSAPPYLPETQPAPAIVPSLPLPDVSATVAPEPASKVYPATRPGTGGGPALVVALAMSE